MGELRDLLAKCKLQVGLSELRLCVDSNSLTPQGPSTKQNQTVLFYSNNFTEFCKWLASSSYSPLQSHHINTPVSIEMPNSGLPFSSPYITSVAETPQGYRWNNTMNPGKSTWTDQSID